MTKEQLVEYTLKWRSKSRRFQTGWGAYTGFLMGILALTISGSLLLALIFAVFATLLMDTTFEHTYQLYKEYSLNKRLKEIAKKGKPD